jgi:serine/threonine protein kinase
MNQEKVRQAVPNPGESVTKSMSSDGFAMYDSAALSEQGHLVFENYRILEELPRGGQAVVYKAVHIPTNTKVAIKVLLPSLLASKRARYYFEREAEVVAALDHPNIVRIRDSGIFHGQYFFVMEYIDGQPLDRYVKAEDLPFRKRIKIFNKVCAAVAYAQQQGIIHRDLKFANILIDKRGEPHILDFGLAKAMGLSEQAGKDTMPTMTGQLAGSLSNMSPEQASGKPELIDMRTDVYALGVILYYLLTNRYPYDVTGSTLQVLQNIQKEEPARPRTFIRRFDSDIEAILLTALAKDKELRYQSVAELKSDLDNWLRGRPIRVRSVSTVYLLRKIIARHRYTSAVAALLLLIVLSFAYVSFDLYLSAEKARKKSDTIAKQWTTEGAKMISAFGGFAPGAFVVVLQAWRDGRNGDAYAMARYLPSGSSEKKAASFLLDPAPLAEKEDDFRSQFSNEQLWFAEFIIGESYLKDGNKDRALQAYRSSQRYLQQLPDSSKSGLDRSLEGQIKGRLYELGTTVDATGPQGFGRGDSEK